MFFGMTLKGPSSSVNLKPDNLHLTNVALELTGGGNALSAKRKQFVSLYIIKDGIEYLICSLNDKNLNQYVGLIFDTEDVITFRIQGEGNIHMSGYYEDEEELSESESDNDSIDVAEGLKQRTPGAAAVKN